MIGVDRFASVFGGAPAHTENHYVEHLRAVIRAGYSPVLCKPGTKETACILSAAGAKKADREAQQRALTMNPKARVDRIRHACGMKHVLDDPAKIGPIVKRFLEVHGGLNVALHLGRSRMLVVDVDTPAEREAFDQAQIQNGTTEDYRAGVTPAGITVESPGSFDYVTGTWVHWGGGHWWMDLPDNFVLPPGKVLKGPGGWAIMYGESYALVPPASRPEGPYRLVGGTTSAPGWLLDQLSEAGTHRSLLAAGHQERAQAAGGPIDRWSAETSWASLLEPHGWIETSMTDNCGCPIWTAPGDHASPKSATAHDLVCARFDVSEGWGPLKIWTDHPPEGLPPEGAVTKLQYVALTEHGGDVGAATSARAIEKQPVPPAWAVPAEWSEASPEKLAALAGQGPPVINPLPASMGDPFGIPSAPPPDPSTRLAAQAPTSSWDAVDLAPFLDGTYRAPVPTLLQRTDGQSLFYPGLTHSVYGETESAKSWICLLACAQAIRAGQHVLYLDMESDPGQIVARLLLLGCTPAEIAWFFHYVEPWTAPAGPDDVQAWFDRTLARPYALAIIDAMSGALSLFGLKPNQSEDITSFYRGIPKHIVDRTGAAVVTVDHVIKDKDTRGRWPSGSERKVSGLTGAAFSVRRQDPFGEGQRGTAEIWIARDRAGGLRGKGGPGDRDGMQQIGTYVMDSTSDQVFTAHIEPQPDREETPEAGDRVSMDVRRYLHYYDGATTRAVVEAVTGKTETITSALRSLVESGAVRVESGARGAHFHYLTQPLSIDELSDSDS